MYLLTFFQEDVETNIAVFESLEEGREFVDLIPGYEIIKNEGEYNYYEETIDTEQLPVYMEIEFNGQLYPLSKFSFTEDGPIDVVWQELPNLSREGQGLVKSSIRIDSYVLDTQEAKDYIQKREDKYLEVKGFLEERGYDVDRNFFGSEDGEAIVYKKKGQEAWHFLTHLDPIFVESDYGEEEIFRDLAD